MLGYKHTNQAKLKMLTRFDNKSNHPMFFAQQETHTSKVRDLISKPGKLNPMYGIKHSALTKLKISDKMSRYTEGVGI